MATVLIATGQARTAHGLFCVCDVPTRTIRACWPTDRTVHVFGANTAESRRIGRRIFSCGTFGARGNTDVTVRSCHTFRCAGDAVVAHVEFHVEGFEEPTSRFGIDVIMNDGLDDQHSDADHATDDDH